LFKGSYERMPLDLWLIAMRAPTRALSEEALYLSSLISAVEMLKTGTTTCLDHYFGNPALPGAGITAEVRAMRDAGMRTAVAFVLADMRWEDTLPLDASAVQPAADDVSGRETAQHLEAAEAFIEGHQRRHPRISCLVGPSAAHRCTDELLHGCRQLATRHGAGMHLHVGEAKSHAVRNRELFGESLVARLDRLGVLASDVSMAHCVWLDDDEIERTARAGASVVHNPASNLKLGSGVARVRDMLAAGVLVAVATDGPCSSDNFNMFEAMRLAGLLHTSNQIDYRDWLPARQVLQMATVNGARAAGLASQTGSLEAGKRADVVLLSRDSVHWAARNDPFVQLVYCENGSSVDKVFVDGELVVDGGHMATLDEQALYDEVGRMRASLAPAFRDSQATVAPLEGPIHDMWDRLRERGLGFEPSALFR
jgi:cytosine/adenosine deaminase-related metal-dependent hydrolase